jgi:hypothetical protein
MHSRSCGVFPSVFWLSAASTGKPALGFYCILGLAPARALYISCAVWLVSVPAAAAAAAAAAIYALPAD